MLFSHSQEKDRWPGSTLNVELHHFNKFIVGIWKLEKRAVLTYLMSARQGLLEVHTYIRVRSCRYLAFWTSYVIDEKETLMCPRRYVGIMSWFKCIHKTGQSYCQVRNYILVYRYTTLNYPRYYNQPTNLAESSFTQPVRSTSYSYSKKE